MATSFTKRAIIVIPASAQATANNKAQQIDAKTDLRTFVVGLSPSGVAPATHYWCSWAVTLAQWNTAVAKFPDGTGGVRYFDASTTTPEAILTLLGLKRIPGPRP